MCLEQCLSALCCVSDKWKLLLLASMLGTAITMIDVYSDIFVAIDFVYQGHKYWAAALIGIIMISNTFITREVIVVMKPESIITVFCVAILSMLGFGPVVLLCFLFFDGDDDHKTFISSNYSIQEQSKFNPSSDAYNYFHKIVSIRSHMAKIRAIESFSESMLSFSLQITYLILFNDERIIYNKNWMIIISIAISIFSFGSGLTKWVRNYARISAFHNKSAVTTKWYYNVFGVIYFSSDLAMRIIPFILFYLWCTDKDINTSNGDLIFHSSIAALVIWEILCCRGAAKIWSYKYEMNDSLMDPNGFLGGILYCIISIFTSYYYMSQLPFNCFSGLVMLMRYIINSAAFIVFFMSINYSFTKSWWTLLYLSLYLLNVLTFLIWLFFKYHWLSTLAIEKGGAVKMEINEPLLKNKHKNKMGYAQIGDNEDDEDEKEDDNELYMNNNNMINIKHHQHYNNSYNNNHPSSIQMQPFNQSHHFNSQPIPQQYQINNNHPNNMMYPRSLSNNNNNNNIQQMQQMKNLGIVSGYNPPSPHKNAAAMQQFQDYQYAMQLQQQQLYKAAKSKKIVKKHDEYVYGADNLDIPPPPAPKQPKEFENTFNNKAEPSIASSVSSQNNNVNAYNPALAQMQHQAMLLQQQRNVMKQQYDRMNAKNNEMALKLEINGNVNPYNKQQVISSKMQKMYKQQQNSVMMGGNGPNPNGNEMGDDEDDDNKIFNVNEIQETEEMYVIPQNLVSDGQNVGHSVSPQPQIPYHRINNNSNAKSDSLLKEGIVQQQKISFHDDGSVASEYIQSAVVDSFDTNFIDYNKNGKIKIEKNNLMVRSTEYNHHCWYNIFGKIITQNNVQYHWRIRIKQLNSEWIVIVGIMDSNLISKYQNVNQINENKDYFAKDGGGYGIDSNGNLKTGGQNAGQYCQPIKQNDIIDIYFDMKQYALWYGLNGNDYGVAYQVNSNKTYKLGISMFGPKHCLEIISCDVVCYKEENGDNQNDKADVV